MLSTSTVEVVTRPSSNVLAELDAINQRMETQQPIDILRWAVRRFGSGLTMATAFGPEGVTLIHMLSHVGPKTHVFNLDTGYQFSETLELRDRIARTYGMEVELVQPEQSVQEYEAANGGPVYKTDPNRCCFQRKIQVLRKAITGKQAWITAIRRDQSPDRTKARIVGWDDKFGLVKINPLANWTSELIWKLILEEDIPYNPLHDQGYASIGCWPCTRAVLDGEDERAGRWSGFAKTECGLHTHNPYVELQPAAAEFAGR
jgi:phosphoadenosine phosphosulfate reductase